MAQAGKFFVDELRRLERIPIGLPIIGRAKRPQAQMQPQDQQVGGLLREADKYLGQPSAPQLPISQEDENGLPEETKRLIGYAPESASERFRDQMTLPVGPTSEERYTKRLTGAGIISPTLQKHVLAGTMTPAQAFATEEQMKGALEKRLDARSALGAKTLGKEQEMAEDLALIQDILVNVGGRTPEEAATEAATLLREKWSPQQVRTRVESDVRRSEADAKATTEAAGKQKAKDEKEAAKEARTRTVLANVSKLASTIKANPTQAHEIESDLIAISRDDKASPEEREDAVEMLSQLRREMGEAEGVVKTTEKEAKERGWYQSFATFRDFIEDEPDIDRQRDALAQVRKTFTNRAYAPDSGDRDKFFWMLRQLDNIYR